MTASLRSFLIFIVTLFVVSGVLTSQDAPPPNPLRELLKEFPHRIVFESKRDGNWELYLMNADGSGLQNLTNTASVTEVNPKASPDGKMLAFCVDEFEEARATRNVYVMNLDGTGRRKIATDARDPVFSPDGSKIAYLPNEYRRFSPSTWATKGLRIYDLATGTTLDHPNKHIEHLYTLAWSPDAAWFFATVHGGMGYRQTVLALEANGMGVFDLGLYGCRPDVTLDGTGLAYGSDDYTLTSVRLEQRDGRPIATSRTTLVRSAARSVQTYHVDWSPDRKFIAFSTGKKSRGRGFFGALPQCPGVDAPGWNICVASATTDAAWLELTLDGESNKEPDWVFTSKETPK